MSYNINLSWNNHCSVVRIHKFHAVSRGFEFRKVNGGEQESFDLNSRLRFDRVFLLIREKLHDRIEEIMM